MYVFQSQKQLRSIEQGNVVRELGFSPQEGKHFTPLDEFKGEVQVRFTLEAFESKYQMD
jgi:hypothetical protein